MADLDPTLCSHLYRLIKAPSLDGYFELAFQKSCIFYTHSHTHRSVTGCSVSIKRYYITLLEQEWAHGQITLNKNNLIPENIPIIFRWILNQTGATTSCKIFMRVLLCSENIVICSRPSALFRYKWVKILYIHVIVDLIACKVFFRVREHLWIMVTCRVSFMLLTLSMLRLHLSKAQGQKDFWKTSKPCHVGIHWIALTEHSQMSTHVPGFQSFSGFFASLSNGQISYQQHKGCTCTCT